MGVSNVSLRGMDEALALLDVIRNAERYQDMMASLAKARDEATETVATASRMLDEQRTQAADLMEREQALSEREKALDIREAHLIGSENELKATSQKISDEQKKTAQDLADRAAELEQREKAVALREKTADADRREAVKTKADAEALMEAARKKMDALKSVMSDGE